MTKYNPGSTQFPTDSSSHLQVILENTIDCILTFNEGGIIESVNQSGLRLFGYAEHEVVKEKLVKLITSRQYDGHTEMTDTEAQQVLQKEILEGKNEFLAKHKNGSIFPVQMAINEIQLESQKLITGFIRDVSGFRADLMQIKAMLGRREAWLAYLLSSHSLVIYSCNPLGNYAMTYISDNIEALTGHTTEECYNDPDFWYKGIHPDDQGQLIKEIESVAESGQSFSFEYRFRAADGHYIWIHDKLLINRDSAGNPIEMVGCWLDISQRKEAEQKTHEERERLKVTLESIGDAVITTDTDGIVDYLNPVAEKLTGWTFSEAVGQPLAQVYKIINEANRAPCHNPFKRCLKEGKLANFGDHTLLISRSGCEYAIQNSAAPIFASNRQLLGAIMVFSDVTAERLLSKKIAYQASHDPLTDLMNRREFEKRLQRVQEHAQQQKTEHVLCYLDLDQFKVVNDTCGHIAGDELLRQIATLLHKHIRSRDILGRLGGDEFGIIMEHCTVEQASRTAESVLAAISSFRFAWKKNIFNIGVSLGLVSISAEAKNIEDLLNMADTACYAAKRGGRSRTHIYQHEDRELLKQQGEIHWVSRINQALEKDHFMLYSQHIRSIKEPERTHYELLLRMYEDEGELILPGAFLPAAERYGLSTKLDAWVIHKILSWLHANPIHLDDLFQCSINLSADSLDNDEILQSILSQLEEYQIPADKICFEITETAVIDNLPAASRFIETLRSKGCRFALDDFGSGLASFAYLRNLPVDYLKIDGLFIKNMLADPADLAMVKSINEIGKVMGKQTIAEYVENNDVLDSIKNLGIDYVQGFAVGRPQPLGEMKLL
jgi:diguanylate cyclase (GGDEF)-like protein/PAS domain S-box-containing protein